MTVAIYGFGGFGREILQSVIDMTDGEEIVFVDDDQRIHGIEFEGIKVVSPEALAEGTRVVLAMASAKIRQSLEQKCHSLGWKQFDLFAKTCSIGQDTTIGKGAVFCAFSMVTASAKIGRQFQCNIYSYVAHDCVIGNYVTFAPSVKCNGNIEIGDGAYIGTGAILRQGAPDQPLRIGAEAIVGMGAVVTRDVPAGTTVVGNPAKPLRR